MNGDNNIGGPDHEGPDHGPDHEGPDHDGPARTGPESGSGSGWTEHTPSATGDIDISVAYANPPTD
ncbi:MAG: hypothetical protein VXB94_12075, partial [Rhodobiaceae bacterium]